MNFRRFILVACAGLVSATAAESERMVRSSDPRTPEAERAGFTLPEGFTIELFAAEPMINKPVNLSVDEQGRLWVSSTVEYPFAAEKDRWVDAQGSRVRDSRDAIKILTDTDGDGAADQVRDFASGLNIPTGVLPYRREGHHEGCIAWSIPNIWYFADTTGDGKADHREVLFGPLGYERDTHGMCSSFRLGPDGWVYATHGFNNTSTLRGKDGSEIQLESGNVFRFRPDGSRVEVWSRGQVNPFGLTFDHRGNLYSADCHSAPIYQLLQGATYPHFGESAPAGLGFGPKMIQHSHNSTGIAGIVYFDRNRWGEDWNDRILIGNPVTSRINLDRIEFRGSTPHAVERPDFLVSSDLWFRPVDLCFGPDNALYVADFYNRIIGHYEVPLDHPGRDRERGRIWRITRDGAATEPVRPIDPPADLANPVAGLRHASPFVRRQASHQLQLVPRVEALAPLLTALRTTPREDTHLHHVMRLATVETLKQDGAFREAGDSETRELAELALAVPTSDSAAYLMRQKNRNAPQWVHIARYIDEAQLPELISVLRNDENETDKQVAALAAIQQGLDERGRVEPLPELLDLAEELAIRILDRQTPEAQWREIGQKSASPWCLQERQCADGEKATVLSSLRERNLEKLTGTIESNPFAAPSELRFWICGHRGHPSQTPNEKNYVSLLAGEEELHRVYPPRSDVCRPITWQIPAEYRGKPVRLRATDGDSGNSYAWLGIARIEPAIISVEAFESSSSGQLRFLAETLKLTAPVSLRDRLKPWLPSPPVAPVPVPAAQREQIDNLLANRVAGYAQSNPNPENGAKVFGQHCAACHQIGGQGGLIGPQLDGIGARGIERITEDILDPNRNVDAHFQLTRLELKDGQTLSGFILAEHGNAIQLRDAAGQQRRILASQVESRQQLPLSLMPPVFAQTIPEAAFYDMIAWLAER